jgi:NADH-quinone oxidoreductase subunit I
MYLLAIVKGMITIKHLFTRKVTIQYPEQVRESPVYRGQHQLKRDEQGREITACGYVLSCPAEAITMTAEERKPDEKHLYRRRNMLRYMK